MFRSRSEKDEAECAWMRRLTFGLIQKRTRYRRYTDERLQDTGNRLGRASGNARNSASRPYISCWSPPRTDRRSRRFLRTFDLQIPYGIVAFIYGWWTLQSITKADDSTFIISHFRNVYQMQYLRRHPLDRHINNSLLLFWSLAHCTINAVELQRVPIDLITLYLQSVYNH